ncbi:MAG: gluconokinase [Succinivibrionaceae bacterium]|nr:gluconokinase [Succinivibrionaceae bacterium]
MAAGGIVVMGVSGVGKSSVGEALAAALGGTFIDGDDLHPRANIDKMGRGEPLTDADRAPWLERVGDALYALSRRNRLGVIACSALRRSYRERILAACPTARFIFLDAPEQEVLSRIRARKGHFMGESMLRSQYEALEAPTAEERSVLRVDATRPRPEVVAQALALLGG